MPLWIERSPLPTARHDLQCVAIGGDIYAISGADDETLSTVEVYDSQADRWRVGKAIPTARGWFGAVILKGKIYAVGGKTIRSIRADAAEESLSYLPRADTEVYDPVSVTWRKLSPMPGGARAGVGAAALNGEIWIVGGNLMRPGDERLVDSVEIYNPRTNSWRPGPALPRPCQGPGVIAHHGCIYAIGGMSDMSEGSRFRGETLILDPREGAWRALSPQPTPRESFGIVAYNDRIYTFGGRCDGYSDAAEVFDIRSDSWVRTQPLPQGKAWLGACVARERIFIIGGAYRRDGSYVWLNEVHEFVF